jgi:hypothetical protein
MESSHWAINGVFKRSIDTQLIDNEYKYIELRFWLLYSPPMLLVKSSRQHFSFRNISIVLLVALMCSLINHTFEHEFSLGANDKQECQLCQHNIDTPKQVKLLTEIIPSHFIYVVRKSTAPYFVNHYFTRPAPRGPPATDKLFT